ncbi:BPSL0761 family protein [Pseudomonas aeruginosa]|uniref:BPSL0761 family protein n=1 Tax=Pseudomonas aeruginosa TaxID=287 RepID=UPI00106C7A52|nr:BPSL0761 family protein [Pseudomonas aeruginosa]
MTLPCERTRSVVLTKDFLTRLSQDTALPESIRDEARQLLRHYPSKHEVLQAGLNEEQSPGGVLSQAVFSSKMER